MKIKSAYILSIFLIWTATLSQPTQAKENECLGKVCVGMTESQVRARLGKPLNSENRTCGRRDLTYVQGGISLQDGATYRITTHSSRWKIEKGIKVGDSISKAQKAYILRKGDLSDFHTDLSTGAFLTFSTDSQQKIKEITLHHPTVC
jgi:hypothetical protein